MLTTTTLLGFIVCFCAIFDLYLRKIPNLITLPTALIGFSYHLFQSGLDGLFWSISGWGLGLALLIVPYALRFMGAGDVKLMAAVGALIGPTAVFHVFLYTAIIGAIYALIHQWANRNASRFITDTLQILKHLILFRRLLPAEYKSVKYGNRLCYGLAIAAGTYVYIGETLGLYRIIST